MSSAPIFICICAYQQKTHLIGPSYLKTGYLHNLINFAKNSSSRVILHTLENIWTNKNILHFIEKSESSSRHYLGWKQPIFRKSVLDTINNATGQWFYCAIHVHDFYAFVWHRHEMHKAIKILFISLVRINFSCRVSFESFFFWS